MTLVTQRLNDTCDSVALVTCGFAQLELELYTNFNQIAIFKQSQKTNDVIDCLGGLLGVGALPSPAGSWDTFTSSR